MLAGAGQHFWGRAEKYLSNGKSKMVDWITSFRAVWVALVVLLPIKTLMAGVLMKCHLFWKENLSVSTKKTGKKPYVSPAVHRDVTFGPDCFSINTKNLF